MLIAVACVTLIALASLALSGYLFRSQREERAQNAVERRELLERIQRPERPPVSTIPAEAFAKVELPPDEFDKVGTIVNDPEAYLKFLEGAEGG